MESATNRAATLDELENQVIDSTTGEVVEGVDVIVKPDSFVVEV